VALARVTRTLLDRMGAEELSNRATAVLAQGDASEAHGFRAAIMIVFASADHVARCEARL
jgi:hypothetical protein